MVDVIFDYILDNFTDADVLIIIDNLVRGKGELGLARFIADLRRPVTEQKRRSPALAYLGTCQPWKIQDPFSRIESSTIVDSYLGTVASTLSPPGLVAMTSGIVRTVAQVGQPGADYRSKRSIGTTFQGLAGTRAWLALKDHIANLVEGSSAELVPVLMER